MNDDRMLSVSGEERSLHIERIRGRRKKQFHNTLRELIAGPQSLNHYFTTTIVPVIFG